MKAFSLGCVLALVAASVSAQAVDLNAPFATGRVSAAPGQAAAALAQPVSVSAEPVTLVEVASEIRARLSKLPGVRAVEDVADSPTALRLVAHSDVSLRLDNLMRRLNVGGADRPAEYDRFENSVRALLERNDPFKIDQLRLVIRATSAIDAFEVQTAAGGVPNTVVRRPFATGLEEVVVGDTPTTIALMPTGRLVDLQLGTTEAFDRARANTAAVLQNVRWTSRDGLLEAQADSSYETSLLSMDGIWPMLSRRLGGPIAVAAPTRDKIIVGRADKARDMARLRAIAASGEKSEIALSSKVLVRRGTIWTTQ